MRVLKKHYRTRKHNSSLFLFYRTAASVVLLYDIFPKFNVPSVSAAPKNCVSQYFNRKAWFWYKTLIFSFQCHNDLPRLALLLRIRGSQEAVFADTNLKVIQDRTPQGTLCSTLVHPQDTYVGFLSICSIPVNRERGKPTGRPISSSRPGKPVSLHPVLLPSIPCNCWYPNNSLINFLLRNFPLIIRFEGNPTCGHHQLLSE